MAKELTVSELIEFRRSNSAPDNIVYLLKNDPCIHAVFNKKEKKYCRTPDRDFIKSYPSIYPIELKIDKNILTFILTYSRYDLFCRVDLLTDKIKCSDQSSFISE